MSLTDADLRDLKERARTGKFVAVQNAVPALVNELLDLRARVVGGTDGPDQGDPAAPVRWLVEWPCIDESEPWEGETFDDAEDAENRREDVASEFTYEYGERVAGMVRVVPLYRAPGAVAAAPPGNEDAVAADLRAALDAEDADMHRGGEESEAWGRTSARLREGWRLVPPAPPAGHEDEAAVERAARAYYDHLRGPGPAWDDLYFNEHNDRLAAMRAALAAARGPRTPDPEAGA